MNEVVFMGSGLEQPKQIVGWVGKTISPVCADTKREGLSAGVAPCLPMKATPNRMKT